MARSARVLHYWLIRTYKEGWSSNHISILQWSHIKGYTYTYLESSSSNYSITELETLCLQGFRLFPRWTSNDIWPPWKRIGIIYSTRLPKDQVWTSRYFHFLIEITCSQCFQTLTSGDIKWPLTSMENNTDHLPTKGYRHTMFEVQATFAYWDNVFTRFPDFDLWLPHMTSDLHGNIRDHLPTKGYQNTKFEVQATFSYWDTVFTRFPVFDLWWPQMTSMENNKDHLPTKGYQYTKCEVPATITYWDNMFTRFSDFDLRWPQMTSMENNADHLPTKGYQHTKFEVQATLTCWDTVFTRFPVYYLWWPQMNFDLHGKQ